MTLRILYLEPFDTGSHAAFTRTLTRFLQADWTVLTLPGRHWKWRMRGAAPYWALDKRATLEAGYDLVFASSYVPLAELYGLVPELAGTPSILYFHENQLAYPVQSAFHSERDHHFGVSQLVSGLAASRLVFNSAYNRDSFLDAGRALLRRLPDRIPPGWIEALEARSEVLGLPLSLPDLPDEAFAGPTPSPHGPLILWNHRWEHDKGPEDFAQAILQLAKEGLPFELALCGQRFKALPEGFGRLAEVLGDRVLAFGDAEDRATYEGWLRRADLAVSAAHHEFFGVAMLEAAHFGADCLVPDDLAYPELFGREHRYARGELTDALRARIERYLAGEPLRADRRHLTAPFGDRMVGAYTRLVEAVASSRPISRSR